MHTLKLGTDGNWEVGYRFPGEGEWVKLFGALDLKDAILTCNVLNGGNVRQDVLAYLDDVALLGD